MWLTKKCLGLKNNMAKTPGNIGGKDLVGRVPSVGFVCERVAAFISREGWGVLAELAHPTFSPIVSFPTTPCCSQSSSSLDTLVAMSRKASGAPHRRLNRTPLVSAGPLGSWHTSASKATREPAAPWVQDRRKGPAWWTWQPQPCAASRRASTTSAGSRGLRTLTSQPHRGVRGSDAFWYPDR